MTLSTHLKNLIFATVLFTSPLPCIAGKSATIYKNTFSIRNKTPITLYVLAKPDKIGGTITCSTQKTSKPVKLLTGKSIKCVAKQIGKQPAGGISIADSLINRNIRYFLGAQYVGVKIHNIPALRVGNIVSLNKTINNHTSVMTIRLH